VYGNGKIDLRRLAPEQIPDYTGANTRTIPQVALCRDLGPTLPQITAIYKPYPRLSGCFLNYNCTLKGKLKK